MSVGVFAQDVSDDSINNETDYIKEVNSVMHDKSTTNTDNQAEKPKEDKKYSIDSLSYIKILLALGFVVLLIYGISVILKKFLKIKGETGESAIILSNQSLGPGKWLQVVFVSGKFLVLGVTNDNVSLVTEIVDPKEVERLEIVLNETKTEAGTSFFDSITDVFKNILHKKSPIDKFDYESDSVEFLKKQNERINDIKE